MGQDNSKSSLIIKIIDGETQSQELFDFQKISGKASESLISASSYIVTDGQSLQYTNTILPGKHAVFQIFQDKSKQITINDLGKNKHLWRVIKNNQSYPLQVGDTLKIGKIKLQLKQIVNDNKKTMIEKQETERQHTIQNQNDEIQSVKTDKSSSMKCRICFQNQNNKNNPLVCLCKCSGSIRYIHIDCLKDWIWNNVAKKEEECFKSYSYFQLCCQICKSPLPTQFKHQGKKYSLMNFATLQAPYAQFQNNEQEGNRIKYNKYLVSLSSGKQVIIGRNNTSQVIMKDISISRTHCSLQYKNGVLLVRDKSSKFGTLVKAQNQIQFNGNTGVQFQYESKLVELIQEVNIRNCCCAQTDHYKLILQNNPRQAKDLKQFQLKSATIIAAQSQQFRQQQSFMRQSFQQGPADQNNRIRETIALLSRE